MINNYQDAIAIYRAYRPYKQEDKPDIVTRIFQIKVIDIIAYKPFGRTITSAYDFVVCCSSS